MKRTLGQNSYITQVTKNTVCELTSQITASDFQHDLSDLLTLTHLSSILQHPHHPHHNLHHFQPRHYRTMYSVRGLSDKAHELAESGQYEKALELVNSEIKTDPNNANAWYNKRVLLFKMCRCQDARNSFA